MKTLKTYTLPDTDQIVFEGYGPNCTMQITPLRTSVTVGGKTLTPHEVVMALKQLTTPPPPPARKLGAGDVVKFKDPGAPGEFLVVTHSDTETALRTKYNNNGRDPIIPASHLVLVKLDSGGCHSAKPEDLEFLRRATTR